MWFASLPLCHVEIRKNLAPLDGSEQALRPAAQRVKGILRRKLKVSEEEAYLSLRRQSRQMRKSRKEVAQIIIQEKGGRSRNETLA